MTIDYRWVDAGESVDRLSAVTMAELRITIDDLTVTSHIAAHSHSRSITVPLYPLAEWLTSWWWPLFHEHGGWDVVADPDYLERHDMSFAAAGFVFPSVVLQPTGRFLHVRVRRLPRTHSAVDFLAEGSRSIPLAEAQARLSDLVSEVVDRLESKGCEGTSVQADWEAIGELRGEEQFQ